MPVSHAKVSGIADGADTSLVRPGDWNNGHVVNVDLTAEVTGALPVANGGTGSATASAARTALGVDTTANITDSANKRFITDAQQTVLGNTSGTNTGDQTSVSGNAGTATALQSARTIGGVSFDGTANIVPQTIQSINEATDTTCFPLFISASGSQSLQPLNNTSLTFNANTGAFAASSFGGAGTGLTGTAASLSIGGNAATATSAAKWTTARNLAGNSVDGSAAVTFANKFIVQGTADAGLSAAQFLGALGTGIVKNTTTTGVLSVAVAGDFPTLNQNTSGSAATLTTGRTISTTGDVTYTSGAFDGSGNVTGAATIAANAVTNAKMATMANNTIKSNVSGGTAVPSDNTMTSLLDIIGSTQGQVLYRGAASWSVLGTGSAGQLLSANGAGANPSWISGSGPLVYASSTPSTIAGTGTETAFAQTYSIGANTMSAGDVFYVYASGVYSNTLTPTLEFKLKAGTTALLDSAAITTVVNQTNSGWEFEAYIFVNAIGASGALEVQGYAELATALSTVQYVDLTNTATKTVDTTASQALTLTAQWGTSSASNTITCRQFAVQKLNTSGGISLNNLPVSHFNSGRLTLSSGNPAYAPVDQTPSSTDTTADTCTFTNGHGWTTGTIITPLTTVGGLTHDVAYYVNASSSTVCSFHTTLANAIAGTSKVDLTASITQLLRAMGIQQKTLYWSPTGGGEISLYDGTSTWNAFRPGEISLALSSLTSGLPYDVFMYNNAGTPTLEFLAWTSATVRATALVRQDGVLVKSGATTRRYLGKFYTIATDATAETWYGNGTVTPQQFVQNAYNTIKRRLFTSPAYTNDNATTTFTTASTTWVAANAGTGSKIETLSDQANAIFSSFSVAAANSAANTTRMAVGIDSTTDASYLYSNTQGTTTTVGTNSYLTNLSEGYHAFNLLMCVSAGTGTYTVDQRTGGGSFDTPLTYMQAEVWA